MCGDDIMSDELGLSARRLELIPRRHICCRLLSYSRLERYVKAATSIVTHEWK